MFERVQPPAMGIEVGKYLANKSFSLVVDCSSWTNDNERATLQLPDLLVWACVWWSFIYQLYWMQISVDKCACDCACVIHFFTIFLSRIWKIEWIDWSYTCVCVLCILHWCLSLPSHNIFIIAYSIPPLDKHDCHRYQYHISCPIFLYWTIVNCKNWAGQLLPFARSHHTKRKCWYEFVNEWQIFETIQEILFCSFSQQSTMKASDIEKWRIAKITNNKWIWHFYLAALEIKNKYAFLWGDTRTNAAIQLAQTQTATSTTEYLIVVKRIIAIIQNTFGVLLPLVLCRCFFFLLKLYGICSASIRKLCRAIHFEHWNTKTLKQMYKIRETFV